MGHTPQGQRSWGNSPWDILLRDKGPGAIVHGTYSSGTKVLGQRSLRLHLSNIDRVGIGCVLRADSMNYTFCADTKHS